MSSAGVFILIESDGVDVRELEALGITLEEHRWAQKKRAHGARELGIDQSNVKYVRALGVLPVLAFHISLRFPTCIGRTNSAVS